MSILPENPDAVQAVPTAGIETPEWQDKPVHPANKAPPMPTVELEALAADIKKHGMQEPIIYWRDNREAANGSTGPFPVYLLDGVNRLEALRLLGIRDPRSGGWLLGHSVKMLSPLSSSLATCRSGRWFKGTRY